MGKVCNGFSVPLQIFRGKVCIGGKVCNILVTPVNYINAVSPTDRRKAVHNHIGLAFYVIHCILEFC